MISGRAPSLSEGEMDGGGRLWRRKLIRYKPHPTTRCSPYYSMVDMWRHVRTHRGFPYTMHNASSLFFGQLSWSE